MPYFLILAAILIWSSLGLLVRFSGVPVHILIFYSTLFSLFFQSVLFTQESYRKSFPSPGKIPAILLLGLCLFINTFTFLFAYSKTTVANAVLTHYIAPVVVAFLAAIFLKEKLTKKVFASLLISSLGLWIMLGGATVRDCVRNALAGGIVITPDLLGIVSGLTSGVAYAVLIILARVLTQRFNPYALVFIQNCVIALLLLPFVRTFPFEKWWIFAFMGLMHSTVAPFLYYRGLKDVKANSTAILGYFEPVGAIVLSIIFLRELPDIKVFLGGTFILVSGYLTVSQRRLPVDGT